MKQLINQRPGILVLPQSKLIFKPKASMLVEEISDEIQKAIDKGWLKIEGDNPESSETKTDSDTVSHDWEVDYSRVEENLVTITDKISGKSLSGEIQEKKGNQHFTLKDIGTVKKQQFWPTAQAMEQIDGAE
jgi:hypothetical protein